MGLKNGLLISHVILIEMGDFILILCLISSKSMSKIKSTMAYRLKFRIAVHNIDTMQFYVAICYSTRYI